MVKRRIKISSQILNTNLHEDIEKRKEDLKKCHKINCEVKENIKKERLIKLEDERKKKIIEDKIEKKKKKQIEEKEKRKYKPYIFYS